MAVIDVRSWPLAERRELKTVADLLERFETRLRNPAKFGVTVAFAEVCRLTRPALRSVAVDPPWALATCRSSWGRPSSG
jgi:hypothetical protein